MALHVRHNSEEFKRSIQKFEAGLPKTLQQIVKIADIRIGARSVGTYMRNAKGEGARKEADEGPLRSVSSRLARAMQSKDSGSGREFLIKSRLTLTSILFSKELLVPYAFIHEKGGEITIPVTQRMRSFFWAMYFQTSDEKWKHLAITKKTSFMIDMKARPYVEPSINDEEEEIGRRAVEELLALVRRSFS